MTSPRDDGPLSHYIWLRDTYFGFITKVAKRQRFIVTNITQRLASFAGCSRRGPDLEPSIPGEIDYYTMNTYYTEPPMKAPITDHQLNNRY